MAVQVCPVCNGPLEQGDNICKRCGFRLAGETSVFKPVGLETIPDTPNLDDDNSEGTYSLYVAEGPQVGEDIYLHNHRITLGRDPHCDIFLNDMTVSREHAIITVDGDTITIIDDNSLNGTWVDGKVVSSAQLQDGSKIQIGTFTLLLVKHGA